MNRKDFADTASGRLVDTPQGYLAFVPNPLPPPINFDMPLALALSKADAALSELSGLGGQLPNPHLLISPYIKREAVLSSRIEGTKASLSDLLIDEIEDSQARAPSDDVKEVRNYVRALEFGVRRLETLPLSLRLLREIHAELMEGVRGEKATPGEFRRSQNWIGPAGSTPMTAAFVPPPIETLMDCLGDWENFLHTQDVIPDLIQCAMMHVQFETIHPFLDGNGRVGRLLITFFLMQRGRLSEPLLYLSAFIDAHKGDYYDLLQRVRTHGDWVPWIRFFLQGVTEIATEAGQQSKELHRLREQYRSQLRDKPNALAMIDELFVNPYMTIGRGAKVLNKTHPTAKAAIDVLEEKKILKEVSGRQWGRFYVCSPVLDALEKPFS
ncbi:MAG: cell filamentation protein Fic [Hydrogenophilales bacterium 17-61-9]|nr:MAG: cell filamentation protein Fic [Hydrogenophilales bacterium 17-61-9]